MTTLAEFMIVAGADNRPLMLDKNMYDSWKSRMELYIEGKENEGIILNSVNNDPLICPTVEENGVTRVKRVGKDIWDRVKLLMQGTTLSKQEREYVKLARDLHTTNYDQLHAYLQQHEIHANEARLLREIYPDPLALVANHHPSSPYPHN
uniref:Integrase, catalytic region, zinc finger, CCHC-type, peptidase aspartic, catalytic n=1 Tax=Tanacetum cinerariifolium TaxID=118510 RepID=A0A699IYH9_TANCI|nr:hypothetical protein [Tanacetum cinerariifolium]